MLEPIGNFSDAEIQLLNSSLSKKYLAKNEILVAEGDVSTSLYFIVKGCFYQFLDNREHHEKVITDWHIENEWMFNAESLSTQMPSIYQ